MPRLREVRRLGGACRARTRPALDADRHPGHLQPRGRARRPTTAPARPQPATRCSAVKDRHLPVVPPAPNNAWHGRHRQQHQRRLVGGGGLRPRRRPRHHLRREERAALGRRHGVKRPPITFKLKKDGTDVVFQTYAPGIVTELMPDFIGSPSVYFAFAVPQDGIAAPADFNASASRLHQDDLERPATGTAPAPDRPGRDGYYTIRLTGVQIPATATMLTGGVGYTYSLSSAPPLTQINLPAYPLSLDGKPGRPHRPRAEVWKVATGFTGRRADRRQRQVQRLPRRARRRPVVPRRPAQRRADLLVLPHPEPHQLGWSASSKYFIHAIHGGAQAHGAVHAGMPRRWTPRLLTRSSSRARSTTARPATCRTRTTSPRPRRRPPSRT